MSVLGEDLVRDLRAICDRILPPTAEGPSASEAHVPQYIEGQLDGPWGQGARMYRHPPFREPLDTGHGWQSAMTPAQAYVHGLRSLREHCERNFGRRFSDLDETDQDAVIGAWEIGEIDTFGKLDGREFFALVRANVAEGLFCDPSYGGNHEMAGWRWIGYPGVAEAHGTDYADYVDRYSEQYTRDPKPLAWRRQS